MHKLVLSLLLLAPLAMAGGDSYIQAGIGGCSVGVDSWFHSGCGLVTHIGGGGEGFVYRGLAIGGEGGWGWVDGHFRDGVALASANASYHFGRDRSLVPFITGGYSLLFRDFHANGFNLGGGATWWAARHVGLRFDGRLHRFQFGPAGVNVFLVSIGPSFR